MIEINRLVDNAPHLPETEAREPTFAENILAEYVTSAVTAGTWYLSEKFCIWLEPSILINPLNVSSYFIIEIASTSLYQTARLTHYLMLKCIGERGPEEGRVWRLVSKGEALVDKVDRVYSNFYEVRTLQEISRLNVEEKDMEDAEYVRFEIINTIKKVPKFLCLALSMHLGAYYGVNAALGSGVIYLNGVNLLTLPLQNWQTRDAQRFLERFGQTAPNPNPV